MKDVKFLEEKLQLLEQEIATVAEDAERTRLLRTELEDLRLELDAFKIFLGRHYPELKKELPEIVKKLRTG